MNFKIALCQMKGSFDKKESLAKAESMIREAASKGADVIALPEMWNCPYATQYFKEYAEEESGETVHFMSSLSKELKVYLVAGSIPELERLKNGEERVYNTNFSFDKSGALIGKHRKAHLFDIDVKGGIRFKESDILTSGREVTIIDTEYCKIGIAICYDVRFPELFRKMTLSGVKAVILPAAFNMTTGPAHWEITMRARALDNQIYFAAVSPARDQQAPYQAYGNSCLVNPWGEFCAKADSRETIVYGTVDLDYLDEIREQLPLLKHRKPELYD
ncbi:carbon-nitrogen hydrolase family protein [Clostridium aminobutyricum]|uniref:Carbon-nitrogen hydrolase family protein n=1 Tax=Clostridium aminobutyricum TaxID=33953 RepID=A0A939D7X9_CLOAM|nr:carbon-nitrogen hydrolase family protein [Clostridium aminobutyricum]MBN7772862.1 carbon-nitrogen hydrolase family protein [Clostridium aminobutyricum]